jgi:uroporphyrinogen-III synthase
VRPRILVTRPEPGASRTAARLGAAGFDAVVLPLTKLEPLIFALPEGPFEALIVTSAQALKSVGTEDLLHLTVFAVGETTAESARSSGFSNVITAGGSVKSIAALVLEAAKPAARLLYLCGKVRRPELEAALGNAGIQLTAVETYDALPVDYSREQMTAHLGQAPFDAVTLMSARAAEQFSALAEESQFAPLFTDSEIVCFSPRIATVLLQHGVWKLRVTAEATEDSLLETLREILLLGRG